MITQASTANRHIDDNVDDLLSTQSMITEKMSFPKSKRNTSTGFQPQTQTVFVTLNAEILSAETNESIFPTEVTGIPIPARPTLIPVITIPLQFRTENIRSSSDIRNDPNTSGKIIVLVQLLINFKFKTQHL